MKKTLLLISSFLMLNVGYLMASPSFAYADTVGAVEKGINSAGGGKVSNPEKKLNNTIHNFIKIFSAVVGIIAIVMIIVGGLRFITSGGDANAVASARKTIIYALVGIAVIVMANIIISFAIQLATNQ